MQFLTNVTAQNQSINKQDHLTYLPNFANAMLQNAIVVLLQFYNKNNRYVELTSLNKIVNVKIKQIWLLVIQHGIVHVLTKLIMQQLRILFFHLHNASVLGQTVLAV